MDLNTISITGRLGADPTMRYTSNEMPVTSLRVAVQLAKEKTVWFDVSVWGKMAETTNQYTAKGSRVAITGRLDQDEWEGDDGKRRTSLKIIANSVVFLDPKSSGGSSGDGGSGSLVSNDASDEVDDSFPL